MKNILILASVIIIFCGKKQAFSQTSIHNDPTLKNRTYLRTGIEPCINISFGYERKFDKFFFKKPIVSLVELSFYKKGYELKTGGIFPLFETENFKIVNYLNLSAGTLTTKNFKSKKFAVADEIAFGLYKPKWFLALTTEYEKIYLNHIKHTDFYRETYYEDAIDGWYKGGGGMFQFGIEGGMTLKQKIDIHIELKMPFTEKFNGYGGSPAHINLGVGYRF